jgi:hypothetical protein
VGNVFGWSLNQIPTRNGYGKVCMENGGESLLSSIHIFPKALQARAKEQHHLYHYQISDSIIDGDE